MEGVIIRTKNKSEITLLKQLAKKMKLSAETIEESIEDYMLGKLMEKEDRKKKVSLDSIKKLLKK